MEEYDSNSGNEKNINKITTNMDKWTNEIEQNNLENLDNYISNTFALLRDKRLYGSTSKYGLTNDDMNTLIPKIKTTIEIIINNNYLTQIKDRTNIAKLGAIIKGLSNGTFRGGKFKKTHKKRKHSKKNKKSKRRTVKHRLKRKVKYLRK
jgi:hypothetical protein